MNPRKLLRLLPLAAAALAACQSMPGGQPQQSGAGIALGANLAGEPCRMEPRKGVAGDPQASPPQEIFCGEAKRPVAELYASVLPLGVTGKGAEGRDALRKVAAESAPGRDQAARLLCEEPVWTAPADGLDVSAASCRARDGNWPRVALTAAIGKILYQGDGLPTAMPAVERAILRLAGKDPASVDRATAEQRLQTVTRGQSAMIASRDLDDFEELTERARLHNSTRNYGAAEAAWRRALEIQTRVSGPSSPAVAEVLVNLGLEVSNQGRFEEAEALFRRAEPAVDRSPDPAERAQLSTYRAYNYAADAQYGKALSLAREATRIRRGLVDTRVPAEDIAARNAQVPARGELARSLLSEAVFALRADEVSNAESAALEALTILALTPNLPPWWRSDALAATGEINLRLGRIGAAERNLKEALKRRQQYFGDTAPTARAYIELARVYAEDLDWKGSVASYRNAFDILGRDEIARASLEMDQVLPFLTVANKAGEREPGQQAALDAEMFRAVQLVASTVTDQTIARTSARMASDDPKIAELVRQLQEAQRERDNARIELAHETAKPDDRRGAVKEAELSDKLRTATATVEQLTARIAGSFPDYTRLAAPRPAELAELQRNLGRSEAVLLFAFGRTRGYVLLVRNDRFLAREIGISKAELADSVQELRRAFDTSIGKLTPFDLKASHALYKKLVAPVAEGLSGVDHVVAVPSGPLASLPLGVLVASPDAADYRSADWLAKRFALSQVTSVRAFLALRAAKGRPSAPEPMLAFADPAFQGVVTGRDLREVDPLVRLAAECREGGGMPAELISLLERLPESADEARRVATLLGAPSSAVFVGGEANETRLREQALDRYRVLYFATHGLLPGELRCQSEPGLVLSPPGRGNTAKAADGLLDASEIAALRLNADLVVLSACNTAAGGKFGGEALSGLAEAFFHAGARALLASHWAVSSVTTVRLMTGLFERSGKQLESGLAYALRDAQLAIIAEPKTAHPFFWAPFTMIGDGGAAKTAVAQAGGTN